MKKPIELFRPGRHVAMSGEVISFSESDLRATAEAYDPAVYEAPLVVGHPTLDAPAYGWTKALAYDGVLTAEPTQVDASFAEMVNAGRFKRVSGSFFKPDAKQNPKPGVYYLRHIGFLGAHPPAVKGLKPVNFAAGEEGVIDFAEDVDGNMLQRILRGFREFIINKFTVEDADRVAPDWMIESVRRDHNNPTYAAPHIESTQETPMKNLLKLLGLKEDATEADAIAALSSQSASFAEREKKIGEAETKARRTGVVAFVEGLVKEGKLLPRHQAPLIEFMAAIDSAAVIEFAESADSDARVKKPSIEWLRGFLAELPQQVDYTERARGQGDDAGQVANFAAPAGYSVDPKRLELHRKVLAHQAQHPNTSYDAALTAVSR